MKESNTFVCQTCVTTETMNSKESIKHLRKVHDFDAKETMGQRSIVCHVDAVDWYKYIYDWKFGEIQMIQTIVVNRKNPW